MKRFTYFLLTAMLLTLSSLWSGVEADPSTLTLYGSETTQNSYIPVYGDYIDTGSQLCQFIYPEADITALKGQKITALKFYSYWYSNVNFGPTFTIKIMEVAKNTYFPSSSPTAKSVTDATTVYSGTLSVNASKEMEITLSTEFECAGDKDLLIQFSAPKGSTAKTCIFYGKTASGQAYYEKTSKSTTKAKQDFLPRVTFTYEAASSGGGEEPSCAVPTDLTVPTANITASGAKVTWVKGEATSSTLEYKLNSASEWTIASSGNTAGEYTFASGLSANTKYDVRVKNVCGEEASDYTATISFTTDCEAKTAPYTCGFETSDGCSTGTIPACWKKNSSTSSPAVTANTEYSTYAKTGSQAIRFNSNNEQYLVLPQFTQEVKNLQISFWYKHYYYSYYPSNLVLGSMTDPTDKTTFTQIKALTQTNDYTQITEQNLATAPDGDYYIAFKYTATSTSASVYLDDVNVEVLPSCKKPVDLAATAASASSINLSWTAKGDETAWQVQYRVGSGSWSSPIAAPTNPFTLTGLSAQTTYEMQVRANCGGEQSAWSASATETTECEPISAVGFDENFDAVQAGSSYYNLPDCWDKVANGNYPYVYNYYSNSASNCLYFTGGTSTTVNVAILPPFSGDLTTMTISFNYRNYYTSTSYGQFSVGYYQNGTFTSYDGATLARKDSYTSYELPIPSMPEGARLAIQYAGGAYSGSAFIDDVRIFPTPTCAKPTDLTKTATYFDGATFSWTKGDEEDAWTLEYSTNNSDWTEAVSISADATSKSIRSLEAGTYYARVKAVCGVGDESDWSNVVSFTPTCVTPSGLKVDSKSTTTATISWTVNSGEAEWNVQYKKSTDATWTTVEGVTANPYTIEGLASGSTYQVKVAATCNGTYTTAQSFNTDCDVVSLPFSEDFSGSITCWALESCHGSTGVSEGAFRFYYSSNPPQYLISPELEASSKPINVEFSYKAHSTSYPETFHVGYSTTTAETSAFTWGAQITCESTSYASHAETLPAGTKYVAIKYTSNDQYYLYVDNFSVEEAPTCPKPTAVTVSSVTAHTASVGWTNGGTETAWKLQTSTDGTSWGAEIAASSNPFTLTELDANTTYYVRVKADCGGGDLSEWSNASADFTTECDVKALPFEENFEAGTSPQCWSATNGVTNYYDYDGNYGWKVTADNDGNYVMRHKSGTALTTPALTLPQIDLTTVPAVLSFKVLNNYSNKNVAGKVTVSAEGVDDLVTVLTTSSSLTEQRIALSSFAGKRITVKFQATSNTSGGRIDLDDICVLEQLTLADNVDNTATLNSYNGKKADVTIGRTFVKAGYYNTICLPFSLSSAQLAASPIATNDLWAFKYARVDNGELLIRIQEADHINAGEPYLIAWEEGDNIVNPLFKSVTITAKEGKTMGEENLKFVGILKPETFAAHDDSKLFLVSENRLYWWDGDNSTKLNSFRAFFLVDGGQGSLPIKHIPARIIKEDKVATGVENTQGEAVRCIKRIENDQLIIIREGVKYNAQGQKVQ